MSQSTQKCDTALISGPIDFQLYLSQCAEYCDRSRITGRLAAAPSTVERRQMLLSFNRHRVIGPGFLDGLDPF